MLLAELSRRSNADERPACGSGKQGHYDTGSHVFALFLIFALSTLCMLRTSYHDCPISNLLFSSDCRRATACGFPLFSQRLTKGSKRQRNVIFLSQHFGTGVLMATAFVHLLPTAFTSLTDPCLPNIFNEGYRPLAGLVAMVSALVVVALESYLTTRGAGHTHSHHTWEEVDSDDGHAAGNGCAHAGESASRHSRRDIPTSIALDDLEATQGLVAGASPLPGSTPTMAPRQNVPFEVRRDNSTQGDDRESLDLDLSLEELRPNPDPVQQHKAEPELPPLRHIPNPDEQKRMMLQCVLLEAGILFHSVFIGMALSVATGPAFVVFLIAISFHRTSYRVFSFSFLSFPFSHALFASCRCLGRCN